MSRIGKKPLELPAGFTAAVSARVLTIKSSKGESKMPLPAEVNAEVKDKEIIFTLASQSRQAKISWGTVRSNAANTLKGLMAGYQRKLNITGVGFKAAVQGKNLNLNLGYSHPVSLVIPQGLTVAVNENTEVLITGSDKVAVGQFAADVRGVRPPEPFKGKGVRYSNEFLVMKEGKKK